jgi:hypothetical protein
MGDEPAYTVVYKAGKPGEEEEETNWIKRAGNATVTYANGNKFEGYFNAEKKKEGEGTYTWSKLEEEDGEEDGAKKIVPVFKGTYKGGRKTGIGKMTYPNGDTYQGMFENGKRQGDGSYKYVNGDIFSGVWEADKKQGEGQYEFGVDRSRLVGQWENGTIVSGEWVYDGGGSYSGKFIDGKPIGAGMFKFANGYSQEGEYLQVPNAEEEEGVPPTLIWKGKAVESA